MVHPTDIEVAEFDTYGVVIDARSPREYAEDHIPGASNFPVVDNDQYAEVGTRHRTDTHGAYLTGVGHALRNIADQLPAVADRLRGGERALVYCFRGGKRSRLWVDALRTIGYATDVLPGGWKAYRRWVRAGLETVPRSLTLCVLAGATGTGKTRLLTSLEAQGEQVIDLEGFAGHRGSLIGEVPGVTQPTQKWFDSMVFDRLRRFDPSRVVWVEAESKKIGNIQIPPALHDAMRLVTPIVVTAPMTERVKLWHEDYSHLAADPVGMVQRLEPLKPLIGNEELATWRDLAARRAVDELFERVMTNHYDPCYERSSKHGITKQAKADHLPLTGLDPASLATAARDLIARFSSV